MPYRKVIFSENQSYHVFNRSVNKEIIFNNKREINRFLSLIDYYRFKSNISFSEYLSIDRKNKTIIEEKNKTLKPLVEIHSFSLMPNHHHFLIKQLQPKGIPSFVSNIQNGFAKYYNIKNKRHGSLFCGMFKAVLIKSEEQFIHVSRYIHLNPVISNLIRIEELDYYPLTSFSSYMKNFNHIFLTKELIFKHFKNISVYKKFIYDQEDYLKRLNEIALNTQL
ncbi:MAG: transposase [Candidatus Roizmanbacteria bacterium]|nr:transposase [Candidatus Roizmanbacteria bacterium]